jgi:hypothetical protein
MKRVLVVAALVGGSLGVFAGSAHAGEITGPSGPGGKPTQGRETFLEPLKARSACAFSGLNDVLESAPRPPSREAVDRRRVL